jgi:hypothetical protein
LSEKRKAIRATKVKEPLSAFGRMLHRVRETVEIFVFRIRKPGVRAGVSVHSSMTDAVNHQDLDLIEIDWFGGQRMSREWMKNGNAAGSVVPGSYEWELRQ